MKQIVATALVAFIGIIVLAQEAQLSGVHLVGGHRQNATNHNSTHNNNSNSAVLDAVLRNLSHVQAQLNQLTLVVRQLQNSTHNSTHNNSTGNGNHNSTLIPGHNSTIVSGGNFTQLLNISLQNSRQLNSLQNSVNYLTGLLVNLTQHLNITGNGNGNGIHLHPLQNSTTHNSTHNRTAHGHHFKFNQFFLN